MEITSNSLQELINKKAELKAKGEIAILTKCLHNSGLLDIKDFQISKGDYKNSLRSELWTLELSKKENVLTLLYEEKLKEYIISETKDFISKVELLVAQTDNLLNIAENY